MLCHNAAATSQGCWKDFWKGREEIGLNKKKTRKIRKPTFLYNVPSQMLPLMLEISCLSSIRRPLLHELAAERILKRSGRNKTEQKKQWKRRNIQHTFLKCSCTNAGNFLLTISASPLRILLIRWHPSEKTKKKIITLCVLKYY